MEKPIFKKNFKLVLFLVILLFPTIWLRGGFASIYLDLDFARDLHEISNIWIGRLVFLGPEIRQNLHITPLYYYLFWIRLFEKKGGIKAIQSLVINPWRWRNA